MFFLHFHGSVRVLAAIGDFGFANRMAMVILCAGIGASVTPFCDRRSIKSYFPLRRLGSIAVNPARLCCIWCLLQRYIHGVRCARSPRSIVFYSQSCYFWLSASRERGRNIGLGGYQKFLKKGARNRALIYGAGSAGRQLAAGLANSHDLQAVAVLDDNKTIHGSVLKGAPDICP